MTSTLCFLGSDPRNPSSNRSNPSALGRGDQIRNALLIFVVFVPGLVSSVLWIIAKTFRGRKGALLLIFALYLSVNLALPIAGGTPLLAYAGDEEQTPGLVLAVVLLRALELFVVVSTGAAKAVWIGDRR